MGKVKLFNIRVYGLLVEDKSVLVTDEFRGGISFTKFPGGGLEWGEGTIDCLKREFLEELGQPVEIIRHFYTTDFFQVSAFHPDHQLISIYYLVKFQDGGGIHLKEKPFEFDELTEGAQCFRMIPIKELKEENLLFPVDKLIVHKLKEEFLTGNTA